MKKLLFTLFAIIAICVSCGDVGSSKVYYVAETGNDSGPGDKEHPFRSISRAATIMEAGDKCIIREGTYRETINPLNSGEDGKPLTFTSYPGENVCIDGTDIITGWKLYKENIYTAKVHQKMIALEGRLQAMYHNDAVMDIARWPNNEDGDPYTFDGFFIDGGSATNAYAKSGYPQIDLTGAKMTYLGEHSGTVWMRPVLKSDSQNLYFEEINLRRWPFTSHNPGNVRFLYQHKVPHHGQLYVYDKLELLDYKNEWYYDPADGSLYAMFEGGQEPQDGSVKFNTRTHTAKINVDYVVLDGLNFFGGEISINGDYCAVRNCNLQNCSQVSLAPTLGGSSVPNAAISIKGKHTVIERNLLEYGSNNGITIAGGGSYCTVDNNIIRYFNTLGIHAKPVVSSADNTVITRNTIYKTGRDGIGTHGKSCEIAYNDVSSCMMLNNDGGVFYTVGDTEVKHTKIHHNWFHDSTGPSYADGRAAGVYLDNYSKGYYIYNNVLSNITWSGLQYNLDNTDVFFYNNTIWKAGFSTGHWALGFKINRVVISNNIANATSYEVADEWVGTDVSEFNVIDASSDLYEDPEAGNFVPKEGSPLVDAGEFIEYYTQDVKGSRPDIGAYERGGERWVAGATWVK